MENNSNIKNNNNLENNNDNSNNNNNDNHNDNDKNKNNDKNNNDNNNANDNIVENEATFLKLKSFLDSNNISYNLLTHPPAKTSEEVAKLRGTPLETGAKSMIIKIDDGFIEIVIQANKKFLSKPAKKYFNTNCLRFAYKDELENLTHCLQGAVPPFGSLFGLKTYVDKSLFENKNYDYISFNGGLRGKSFQIKKEDYQKIENPILIEICK